VRGRHWPERAHALEAHLRGVSERAVCEEMRPLVDLDGQRCDEGHQGGAFEEVHPHRHVDLDHIAGSMLVTLMCEGLAGGHTQAAFSQPIRFYVDGGDGVFAVVSTTWSNGASAVVLSGYLENCSVTGCPAIAH
jgi:hypothetical protein